MTLDALFGTVLHFCYALVSFKAKNENVNIVDYVSNMFIVILNKKALYYHFGNSLFMEHLQCWSGFLALVII